MSNPLPYAGGMIRYCFREICNVCDRRPAQLFVLLREGVNACKAHVCVWCCEAALEKVQVEEISQLEFNELEVRELRGSETGAVKLACCPPKLELSTAGPAHDN